MRNLKHTALLFGLLFCSMLGATSASAYEFGVPSITEITDNGTSRGRNSLFMLADDSNYMGLSGVVNNGNKYGGSTYMYRLGTLTYADPSGAYTRGGTFFGLGKGWEWDFFSDRHMGLITNAQFDYKTWSNSGGSADTGTGLAYGLELGGLYRNFMEKNTLTSFAILSVVSRSDSLNQSTAATVAYYDQLNVLHPVVAASSTSTTVSSQSSSLIIGADYMVGKGSLTAALALGSGNTTGSKMALLFAAGYNY